MAAPRVFGGMRPRRAARLRRCLPALGLALFGLSAGAAEGQQTPVDLELALAIDVSRSIDLDEARLQRQGYITALRDPEVIEAIQNGFLGRIALGYFEWAGFGHAQVVVDWTVIENAADANAFADQLSNGLPQSASRTSISSAITFGQSWFDNNGFKGTRRVIDVSGDGPNNWGELVTIARDRAVATGITINGLPILDRTGGIYSRFSIENLDLYYRDCVIGGTGAFYITAAGFDDFARAVRRKLVLEVAGRRPAPMAGVILAQADERARASPPCNIGELMWHQRDPF